MKNTANKRKATYYFGANEIDQLFLLDEMKNFEKELADFRFVPAVASPQDSDNWTGQKGFVTDAVRSDLKNAPDCEAYLCGSPGMIDAAIEVLAGLGMSEENIFYDKFE